MVNYTKVKKIPKEKIKICLLEGSGNGEEEISAISANAVRQAMFEFGFINITSLIFNRETFFSDIQKISPDVVFNAMHGKYGEDGVVPLLLDYLKIPYTHSSYLASSLGMNKIPFKSLISDRFYKLKYKIIQKEDLLNGSYKSTWDELNIPQNDKMIIKPYNGGSSCGLLFCDKNKQINSKDIIDSEYFIMEEYFKGREFNIATIDWRNINDVYEVVYDSDIYDYNTKYKGHGNCRHIKDVDISDSLKNKLSEIGNYIHNFIGCKDISRTEIMVDVDSYEKGIEKIYPLEINTNPGLTSCSSFLPICAKDNNISLAELYSEMIYRAQYADN